MEIFSGSKALPNRSYRLIDSKNNDVTDSPVSYSELKEIILGSEASRVLEAMFFTCERDKNSDFREFCADHFLEASKECGFTIIEVLTGPNYKSIKSI